MQNQNRLKYMGHYKWWIMLAHLTKAATNYPWCVCLAISLGCIVKGWYHTIAQKQQPEVQISPNRLRFVAIIDAASKAGWQVDMEKIGRDGYNPAEGLPVIRRQLFTLKNQTS